MFVILVLFDKEHKHMRAHAKELMEYRNGLIAINTRCNKLISSLRSGVEKKEGTLDNEVTSHDAFGMSLQYWISS